MMEVVPDNEQPAGPPALRPPSEPAEVEHAPSRPGQPSQPATVDPEQVRQFQQFQQFQELMRQPGGQLVLPPPAKPLWVRVLRGRLFRKLVLWLIVVLGLYFVYDYYFGNDNDSLPASVTGGGKTETNLLLDTNPYETVRKVYQRVADNTPEQACGRFTTEAAKQFAANNGVADNNDEACAKAVAKLHARVDKVPGSKDAYAEVDFHGKIGQIPDEPTIKISSCPLGVKAGPKLGLFTVNRIAKDQWIITAHQNEDCPKTPPS